MASTSRKRNYPMFEKEKQNTKTQKTEGEPLKIWSWNVSGLRACVKKGFCKQIGASNADIVSLQETKCAELPDEIMALDEYQYKKLLVSKQSKGGYAGVALLSKEKPIKVEVGLGDPDFDEQGRYIQAEYPTFFFIAIYVPNAGQKLQNLKKRGQWDQLLLDKLTALDGRKPVIIGGDMNVAHQEIDLRNPDTNRNKTAGFTDQEREAFTRLLDAGFVDIWRTRNPEETDAYTYWSYIGNRYEKNIGWRLDYFVASERVSDKVRDCEILRDIRLSDHCPISMTIDI